MRNQSETKRQEAETLRDQAEQGRIAQETDRDTAEQERISKEKERVQTEQERISAETIRAEKEKARIIEEQLRETSESTRQANETTRQAQEEQREQMTAQVILDAEQATGEANTAADRANRAAEAAEGVISGLQPDWNVIDPVNKNYIKNKPEIPTLDMAPTAETLSYVNTDGTTINFRIGDEVRVAEDGEYVFYRLYDLAGGKASWKESGSGTALPGNVYLTGANYYNESVRTIKQGYLSNE